MFTHGLECSVLPSLRTQPHFCCIENLILKPTCNTLAIAIHAIGEQMSGGMNVRGNNG